mmetsp:Transcript_5280/g.8078  ORF Transcript_5280/g.8078 Transcript_5280/m.8078 type:complete len:204 (+) Transcript_5280:509-1120(+)
MQGSMYFIIYVIGCLYQLCISSHNPSNIIALYCAYCCRSSSSVTRLFSDNAFLRLSRPPCAGESKFAVRIGYPRLLSLPRSHTFTDWFDSCVSGTSICVFCTTLTSFHSENALHSSLVCASPSPPSFESNETFNGGSSSPGQTLKRMTLRPQTSSGLYSAPPFTNGSIHRSCGRGTACKSCPSKRSRRPETAGTVTNLMSPLS